MSKGAGKASLVHLRSKCIGCGACADVAPDLWSLSDSDGLADVVGGRGDARTVRAKVLPGDEDLHREAAEACPVNIIRVG